MTMAMLPKRADREADFLRALAKVPGPCITLFVPSARPGAGDGLRRVALAGLVKRAADQLMDHPLAAKLLTPLEKMARDPELEEGGPGLVIFRAPDYFEFLEAPAEWPAQVFVAESFHLLPLVEAAGPPAEFFVLALSKKQLRFFAYRRGEVTELDLPAAVPPDLKSAGAFEAPDHAANRWSSAHFGTGGDREAAHAHWRDYCKMIDRGLTPRLEGKLLLLAGVHEEIAEYRRAAEYPHLFEDEIAGNAEFLHAGEVARFAAEAAVAHYRRRGEAMLRRFVEMPDRKRTLAHPAAVMDAAREGRVHLLCVPAGAASANAMVAETLAHGGEVFTMPRERMPGEEIGRAHV